MFTTFRVQLIIRLRNKSSLFWVIAFPIILSTMFYFMFSALNNAYTIDTQTFAVVQNSEWKSVPNSETLVSILTKQQQDGTLIQEKNVSTIQEANRLTKEGIVQGYIYADNQGIVTMALSDNAASGNNISGQRTISVVNNILHSFNEMSSLVSSAAQNNPEVLTNRTFMDSLSTNETFTHEVSLTHFQPQIAVRYDFALIGMAAMMSMSLAIGAVTRLQPNLSALGARQSVSPLSKTKQVLSGFFASWFASFICIAVAFSVMHFIFSVSVGGRQWAAYLGIAVATLMSSAFGTAFGAIPFLTVGQKIGISTAISCVLSFFAGLYGQFAMEFGDSIERNTPIFALINPVRQVSKLFYDILYYDGYAPFFQTLGVLLVMTLIALFIATLLLRRQRYDHI